MAVIDPVDNPAPRGSWIGMGWLDGQRGNLFPWTPVFLGLGIGTYFALPAEPPAEAWIVLGAVLVFALGLALRHGRAIPLLWALALTCAGIALAGARTHLVAAPVLETRYYGPIEGRIVNIDRSASDKVRLTLDQVRLPGIEPGATPRRVRVSLHGTQGALDPMPGAFVLMTGHLSPPQGPVEPGGFDFQRQAWFQGLGAVGYTRTPAVLWAHPPGGLALLTQRARAAISAHVQKVLPGRTGAFATAITTGDRSAMDAETVESLRVSNLAHLLAISGLHMGMLTGFVFAAIRLVLACVPYAALRWPTHKFAAAGAIGAGAIYLALSGGNVATERAFIMAAVMFIAVIFDQRAITLRAVALAALIVLIRRPEALLGPGFQMSFAATAALVAVFELWRDGRLGEGWPKPARWLTALVLSSLVAGLATAPIAAIHFNRVPHFGLIANLLSVPVMGSLVMPWAVLAALLAPFGLSWLALGAMGPGIDWILAVADEVAGWDGAVSHVPTPDPAVMPLIAGAGLWAILWRGRARALALLPAVLSAVLWAGTERPALLISQSGGLIGVLTPDGRALSKPRGDGFAASSWLENDGDAADQPTAAERQGTAEVFRLGGETWVHITGRNATNRARESCAMADVVVTSINLGAGPCRVLDATALAATGAIAVYLTEGDATLVTARDRSGRRPWNTPAQ